MASKYERAIRAHYVEMRANFGVRESIKLTADHYKVFPVVVCRIIGMPESYAEPLKQNQEMPT